MTTTPIVEDFAAIAARQAELKRALDRAVAAPALTEEQRQLAAYYAQCPT